MSIRTTKLSEEEKKIRKRERTKRWRLLNPELNKARRAKSYLRNRESTIAKVKLYASTRKDAKSIYDRARYDKNKGKVKEWGEQYRKSERGIKQKLRLKAERKEFSLLHPSRSMYDQMIGRCYNPNNKSYERYGKLGIRVCKEWLGRDGYAKFCEHMGLRPEGVDERGHSLYTVDRVNCLGNYEPGNVRWATADQQAKNKRLSDQYVRAVSDCAIVMLENKEITLKQFSETTGVNIDVARYRWLKYPYNGEEMLVNHHEGRYHFLNGISYTTKELSIISGYSFRTIYNRIIDLGWTPEKAITIPI